MTRLRTVTLAVLMGLSGLVLATEPVALKKSTQPVADSNCRNVSDLTGQVHSFCGSPAQWVEFESRMAKLDQGFSCRSVRGSYRGTHRDSQPLCLFARQWEYMSRIRSSQGGDTAAGGLGGSAGFGDAMGQMLSMTVNANGYPAPR
jgi:hypothetical protein